MAFTIKQNDRKPAFVVALKDDYGEDTEAPVNLTTAGTCFFSMRAVGGTAVKASRSVGSITSAATGVVTYNWGTADTNTVGTFDAEVAVVWNDGLEETFPNSGYFSVVIVDDIA